MERELAKTYDPQAVEDRTYAAWLEKKYFHAEVDWNKKPYCIVIPPPNITGQLHMGHALDGTIQDILIRWKRMSGYNALWVPGTDHASISTEVKIVEKMAEEGLTKEDIGREKFLERAWEWRNEYGGRIVEQLKKLGSSCDWDRERFTLDPGLSDAVLDVFIRLYEKGYIYRGERLINWCPKCGTSISDAEVEHVDKESFFYHLKYKLVGTDEYISFATTRPETILGDTAVAVNPGDERYAGYVGRTVMVPIVNREIPIIADRYVEADFGTGVVKITPAHDPNDFEVGERHNLPRICVISDDGTMNENAGAYCGMTREDARGEIVEEFKRLGLFVKQEKITHAVGIHERCFDVIEPMLKVQWFVKMDEMAKAAIDVYKNDELRIFPERFGKIYLHWLENIRDWCISRQLWWGHRIPAYYCDACGHIEVSRTRPAACPKCKSSELRQDEDTLDTWFSSALWPFSTLGWPKHTEEYKYFYPTSVLVTSYDIIFFWVVRMVFSGLEQTGQKPFDDVLIHGLVRDGQGRKMSKSLGNGVDPLEVISQYGADTLRLMLVTGNSTGNDLRFHPERLEPCRNFLNKVWNAARFILMNLEGEPERGELTPADKWILSKVNTLARETTESLEAYELGMAVQRVYDFIWDEFCDWYIEMVKPRLYDREDPTRGAALWTLKTVLLDALRLAHPFIPFITEEIFLSLQSSEETIMRSAWPEFSEERRFEQDEKAVGILKDAVRGIRNLRAEMNVAPSRKTKIFVVCREPGTRAIFNEGRVFFKNLAFSLETVVQENKDGITDAVSIVTGAADIYIPLADLVDLEKERERLAKENKRLDGEIARLEGRLGNQGFIAKAPAKLVAEEKEKLNTYRTMKERVEEQIRALP